VALGGVGVAVELSVAGGVTGAVVSVGVACPVPSELGEDWFGVVAPDVSIEGPPSSRTGGVAGVVVPPVPSVVVVLPVPSRALSIGAC